MRNTGLKIGRRKASGFRLVECTSRTDLAQALSGLVGSEMQAARRLLRRALQARGPYGVRLKPQETPVALQLAVTGILECEERAGGTAAQPRWVPWRAGLAPDAVIEAKEALGMLNADYERRALISEVEHGEAAHYEVSVLRAVPPGSVLAVPEASKCGSRSWSAYSGALRCLAEWDRVRQTGIKPSSREVAARALGSSKAWTPARIRAFEDMVGLALDEAMKHTEPTVKLRGPIRWAYRGVTGDGRSAHPWVGLPASMVSSFEILDCRASAVLVIENEKTFEEVVRRTELSEDVLVVFGGGFLGEAEVALLQQVEVPIFAWGDLDPKGIQIVINIGDRVGRPVTPVLMDPVLLTNSPATKASADNIMLASTLSNDGASELASLAAAIAGRGVTVEQEALHNHLRELPDLIRVGS
jgi:hypothetical protein